MADVLPDDDANQTVGVMAPQMLPLQPTPRRKMLPRVRGPRSTISVSDQLSVSQGLHFEHS